MKLSTSFFKAPLRKSDSTIPKHPPTKVEHPKTKRETLARAPELESMPGMLVDVDRPGGGETRQISPKLRVTVFSNSMRENERKQRQPQDRESAAGGGAPSLQPSLRSPKRVSFAKELLRSSSRSLITSPTEEEDQRKIHEDDPQDGHEDTLSCTSSAYTYTSFVPPSEDGHPSYGTATTGSHTTGMEDLHTTLSDLTEPRSWRATGTAPGENWRRRMTCGLPRCGAFNADDDILSAVREEEDKIYGLDLMGEESAGCFVSWAETSLASSSSFAMSGAEHTLQ